MANGNIGRNNLPRKAENQEAEEEEDYGAVPQ